MMHVDIGLWPVTFLQHASTLQCSLHKGRYRTQGSSGTAGKLLAPPVPCECTSDSSVSAETSPGALIAAGRDLSDKASECSLATNQAASEVDSELQKGASSIEGHLPVQPYVDSSSQPDGDSSSQRPFSGARSLVDEPETAESSKHAPHQHIGGSSSSVYNTPQPSLSGMSLVSAASSAPDGRESNPLYACSSSGASTGIRGAQANPYYACSTSSASSGSALPLRQPFWPNAEHAAPAAPSMLSFTAQSIPEAEASEVRHLLPSAMMNI